MAVTWGNLGLGSSIDVHKGEKAGNSPLESYLASARRAGEIGWFAHASIAVFAQTDVLGSKERRTGVSGASVKRPDATKSPLKGPLVDDNTHIAYLTPSGKTFTGSSLGLPSKQRISPKYAFRSIFSAIFVVLQL